MVSARSADAERGQKMRGMYVQGLPVLLEVLLVLGSELKDRN